MKTWDQHVIERLKTPDDAAGLLKASLEDNADSPETTALVLGYIANAFNIPTVWDKAISIVVDKQFAWQAEYPGDALVWQAEAAKEIITALETAKDKANGCTCPDVPPITMSRGTWTARYFDPGCLVHSKTEQPST